MPHGFDQNDDETLGVVIGKGTENIDPDADYGVVIASGGGLPSCSKSILICPRGFSGSSTANVSGNVFLGYSAGDISPNSAGILDCVAIGENAFSGTTQSIIRDVVAIGRDSLIGISQTARYGVAIGAKSGDCSASTSTTHSIGSSLMAIGYEAAKLSGALQTIGNNCTVIQSTGTNASHSNITDHSILIGQGTVCSSSTDGQIHLGTAANHNTANITTAQSITLTAGSGSVTLTPTLMTLSNANLQSHLGLFDNNGYSLTAYGSTHFSGSYSSEMKQITLHPGQVNTEQVGTLVRSHSTIDPAQASASLGPINVSSRSYSSSGEMYIHISGSEIPQGWKVVSYRLNMCDSNGAAISRVTSMVSCSIAFGPIISSALDYITVQGTAKAAGTNNVHVLEAPYSHGLTYACLYMGIQTNGDYFTGGALYITRV